MSGVAFGLVVMQVVMLTVWILAPRATVSPAHGLGYDDSLCTHAHPMPVIGEKRDEVQDS